MFHATPGLYFPAGITSSAVAAISQNDWEYVPPPPPAGRSARKWRSPAPNQTPFHSDRVWGEPHRHNWSNKNSSPMTLIGRAFQPLIWLCPPGISCWVKRLLSPPSTPLQKNCSYLQHLKIYLYISYKFQNLYVVQLAKKCIIKLMRHYILYHHL